MILFVLRSRILIGPSPITHHWKTKREKHPFFVSVTRVRRIHHQTSLCSTLLLYIKLSSKLSLTQSRFTQMLFSHSTKQGTRTTVQPFSSQSPLTAVSLPLDSYQFLQNQKNSREKVLQVIDKALSLLGETECSRD